MNPRPRAIAAPAAAGRGPGPAHDAHCRPPRRHLEQPLVPAIRSRSNLPKPGRVQGDGCRLRGLGRDPATLRRSYTMFDPRARPRGGTIGYYESTERFIDEVSRLAELGISDIGLYFPLDPAQSPAFEAIAMDALPSFAQGAPGHLTIARVGADFRFAHIAHVRAASLANFGGSSRAMVHSPSCVRSGS